MHLVHRGIRIGLDSGGADVSFVSHAHSDHLTGVKKQRSIIASRETLALAGLDAEPAPLENARLIDAGHILGARQIALECDGEKVVYTGDISFKENIFGLKAKIEECDRLIMESTYASPEYKFGETSGVYEQISAWVKQNGDANLLIGAYELGKAQEVIRILNEYCGVTPIVTEKTERFSAIYDSFGFRLERAAVGSTEAEDLMKHPFVGVVPMRLAKGGFAAKLAKAFGRRTLVAIATGWALKYRYHADAAFALSDHADFYDLVGYAEQSGAKEIEFFEGDGSKVVEAAGRSRALLHKGRKDLITAAEIGNHVS